MTSATQPENPTERGARRAAAAILIVLVAAILVWPLDWTVWRIRSAFGHGTGQVPYSQMTAAELKGNKEEFYWDGSVTLECSRSLLPEGGLEPCWRLQGHSEAIVRH